MLSQSEEQYIKKRWDAAHSGGIHNTDVPEQIKIDYINYVRHVYTNENSYADAIMDFRIAIYRQNRSADIVERYADEMRAIRKSIKDDKKKFDHLVKFSVISLGVTFLLFLTICIGVAVYMYKEGYAEGQQNISHVEHRSVESKITIPSPKR